jgi:AraC-like DNA-binding protein
LVRPIVDVAARAGVTRIVRAAPRVPIERVFELWADCAAATGDIALPIRIGQPVRLEDLELMGLAVLTAATGHAALAQAIRYAPIITDSGRWCLDDDGERITIRWAREGDRWLGHRLANEAGIVQFVACMRQLCGPRFVPLGASFRHAAPRSIAAHRAYFRCAIEFAAADDAFWFERRALDVVPAAANPAVAAFVREHAEARVAVFASITSRARDAIEQALGAGERPTIDATALALGTSERTLRRRLDEAGTSWAALLDAMLRDRARTLVTQSQRALTAIALELGFSDASAFTHAYRRWFGVSPSRERRAA